MPNTENMTAQESLSIIASMIGQAKRHIKKNSFYFLLWGWAIMIGHAGVYLLSLYGFERPYLAWFITVPTLIATFVRGIRSRKQETSRTHFDSISAWLWISFTVVTFSLVPFGWKFNFQFTPIILLVTAIPTTVSGVILRFSPLMVGGIVFWLCGIVSFLVPAEIQSLVGAFAIACGYLIPGYLLKKSNATQRDDV